MKHFARNLRSLLLIGSASAIGLGLSAAAQAQQASSSDQSETQGGEAQQGAGGEIIVTAQKRSERLQDVPLSVTAATGATLAKLGVTSPQDLGKVAPGFSYQPSNYGPPVYSIRGIGFFDNTLATSPTVSVYTDQIPLPFILMTSGAALDLERVEVLKGPQGTLFGQNVTGGAINFVAAKPTDDWQFGASAEYARFGQFNLDGHVSGPLSESVRIRLAARTEQGGAWQKSATRPGDKLGDRNFINGRLLLEWEPSDTARITFNVNGWSDKSESMASQFIRYSPTKPASAGGYTDSMAPLLASPVAPRDARIADWDPGVDYTKDNSFYQFAAIGQFDLSEAVQLNTITSYAHARILGWLDSDGSAFNNFRQFQNGIMDTFSQEVRLSGSAGERLKWMVGANYAYSNAKETGRLHFIASNSGVGPNRYVEALFPLKIKSKATAVFGGLDYQLTPELLAQVSARYTKQDQVGRSCLRDAGDGAIAKAFTGLSSTPFRPNDCVTFNPPAGPPPFTPVGGLATKKLNEDNLAWRANLSWKPNTGVHLYANVTKGYKSGAFSRLPLVDTGQFVPAPQESVLAYETGFKIAAMDRTLDLSGAAFYYDYKDKQIVGYRLTGFGNLPGLISIPKSRIQGAEFNFDWRPIAGLSINGGVTYVDSKVTTKSYITKDPFAQDIDISGYRFPITPKWSAVGSADYTFPAGSNLEFNVGTSLTYRSSTPATFGGGAEFVLPAYTVLDLRAGIGSQDDRWHVELWGRNVTDKFYLTNINHQTDTIARVVGQPATYGIRVNFKY